MLNLQNKFNNLISLLLLLLFCYKLLECFCLMMNKSSIIHKNGNNTLLAEQFMYTYIRVSLSSQMSKFLVAFFYRTFLSYFFIVLSVVFRQIAKENYENTHGGKCRKCSLLFNLQNQDFNENEK